MIAAVVDRLGPAPPRTHLVLGWPVADAPMRTVLEASGLGIDAVWAWHRGPAPSPTANRGTTVRLAGPADADAEAVADLAAEEIRFHLPHTPFTRDLPVGRAWVAAAVRESDRDRPVFVATAGETVLGYAVCSVVHTPDDGLLRRTVPGVHGHFLSVGVRADARGRGVGTALVTGVQNLLTGRGVHRFSAAYVPSNPLSSAFWPRRGFVPVWTYHAAML